MIVSLYVVLAERLNRSPEEDEVVEDKDIQE